MKSLYRSVPLTVLSAGLLLLPTGCASPDGRPDNTGTGALLGGAFGALAGAALGGRHAGQGALIGGLSGVIAGGLIGHAIDQDQERRLRQQSPQTLQVIQHNDYVAQHQPPPGQPPPPPMQPAPGQPAAAPAASMTFTPLSVDDIKAMASAGVKTEVIAKEIETSQSKFRAQDIAAAQQAGVDPAVIEVMKSHPG